MSRHGNGVFHRFCAMVLLLGLAIVPALAAAQEEKSSPQAQALYTDAAHAQNNEAYKLATDLWSEFLEKYPKDPLAAKAQHYLGVCELQLQNYDKAAAAFAAVIKNHPKFEQLEDAYLNLGWAQYSLGGKDPKHYEASAATFADMLKAFPKGKYSDQGLYFQGESYYHLGKREEAVAAYAALAKDHPQSKRLADALYALGVTQEELQKWADAGATYDRFLKEFADSDLATEVRMRKAETVLQTGDPAAAEKMFAEVAAVKDFAAADHALMRQAYCLVRQGKDADAGALYARLAEGFPQSAYRPEAVMAAGRSFYRAQAFDKAAPWFEQAAASSSPDAAEAAHWLCRIYLSQKEPVKADELATKMIPAAGESKFLVNLKLDQADARYEQPEKKAESLALYTAIATDHKDDPLAPTAIYNGAFTALAIKKYDEGLKLCEQFLAAHDGHDLTTDVKYVAAECHLQQGDYAKAEAGYRAVTADGVMHPDKNLWSVRLGLTLYLQQKYQETIDALSPLVANLSGADQQAEAQFLIGASQFALDKLDAAAAALAASLAANPKSAQAEEATLLLGRTQRKLNKLDEAQATLRKLLEDFPQGRLLDQAHYYLADAQAAAGNFEPARDGYRTVATKFPESKFVPYALYGEGLALQSAKQHAEAAKAFSTLIEKYPEHELVAKGDALFARALSRRQAGEYAGAAADIDAYLKTSPSGDLAAGALLERGLAEVGQKQFDAAIATFGALLKDHPQYAAKDKVLYELAWAYKSQEKPAEAVATFTRLANEHPDSPSAAEAWFHIAEDQYGQKKYDEAAKSFATAQSKAQPGELHEKATYMLAWTHYQQQAYDKALAQFTAQTDAYPQGTLFVDGLFMKGEALFKLQKYDEALPVLAQAIDSQKLSAKVEPLVLLHAGQAAAQLKKWDESLKYLAVVASKHKESAYVDEAAYEMGWAQKNLGKLDDALPNFETAATSDRGEVGARARFMMGEVYFEKKDFDEASRQYQRCMFGYGGDAAPAEVKNWQAKSGFQAARCAEVNVQEAKDPKKRADALAEARKFYTFVVEKHPQSELAPDAKKRLEALSKL